MTPSAFRRLAVSLPDVVEGAHHGVTDFRTGGRIFATLPGEAVGVVLLTPEQQAVVVRTAPGMFEPVPGGWGARGATRVLLARATLARTRDALNLAWSLRAKPAKSARRARRTPTR